MGRVLRRRHVLQLAQLRSGSPKRIQTLLKRRDEKLRLGQHGIGMGNGLTVALDRAGLDESFDEFITRQTAEGEDQQRCIIQAISEQMPDCYGVFARTGVWAVTFDSDGLDRRQQFQAERCE